MAGEACAKQGRSWASRAAGRVESMREQQFYRFVCLLVVTDSNAVCYADSLQDTMAHFGR